LVLGVAFPTGIDIYKPSSRMRVAAGTAFMLLVFVAAGVFARQRNPYVEFAKAADAHEHGDANSAIDHAKRASEMNPDDAHTQFLLGTLLLDAHRYAEAVAPFTNTIKLRPQFGAAYVNLCAAQRELKLLNEALKNCEQGAKLAPTQVESWFNLGQVRFELNDLSGARDALANAVQINPQGFDENLQYGLVLISTGDTGKALPYLRKAHNLRPQDQDLTKLLTQAQAQ
jgi:cytochrome c-type biogenesis protein CcmH/NrfG